MPCCKHAEKLSAENVVSLKESAVGFGFDVNWVADLVQQYGDDVLGVVVEAMRSGFSVAFVVEIVQKFGPVMLEFLLNLLNKQKLLAASGEVVVADEVGILDASIIETLLQRYLPVILEKYGDQIIKFILDWVVNNLLKK